MSFLFLSKLIPLFFYPLGIVTILLIIAWIMAWRESSKVQLPIAIALGVILIFSNGWVSNRLIQSLEWQHLPSETLPTADAIVLLGGATKSAIQPRPMVDINEQGDRVLYAAKLYQEGKAPLIIAAGGRIEWLGSKQQQPEAADMAQLLEMIGIPSEAIIQEPKSLNTYENAVNVQKILDQRNLKTILLVTSAMHMPRSLSIFQHLQINTIPAPTDFLVSQGELSSENISFGAILLNFIPDAGRLAKTTQALKEYIGMVIYRLKGWR